MKAIIAGVLVDILGSTVVGALLGFVLGVYLISHGVTRDEIETVLTDKLTHAPWNILGIAIGAAISVIAGYVTARIAKQHVYLYAGAVGCISGSFGYWSGLNYYSTALNASLALLTIAATLFGAFLWSRLTSPSKSPEPAG